MSDFIEKCPWRFEPDDKEGVFLCQGHVNPSRGTYQPCTGPKCGPGHFSGFNALLLVAAELELIEKTYGDTEAEATVGCALIGVAKAIFITMGRAVHGIEYSKPMPPRGRKGAF